MKFLNKDYRPMKPEPTEFHPSMQERNKISCSLLRNLFNAREAHSIARYNWLMLKAKIVYLRDTKQDYQEHTFLFKRLENHISEIEQVKDRCDAKYYEYLSENIRLDSELTLVKK